MNNPKSALLAILLAIGMLISTGCVSQAPISTPPPISTQGSVTPGLHLSAIALNNIAKATAAFQTAIIEANSQRLIPDQTFLAMGAVCLKINQGVLRASEATRRAAAVPPQEAKGLLALFDPIEAAIKDSIFSGPVTIQDPKTKEMVLTSLNALELLVNGIRLSLGGTN